MADTNPVVVNPQITDSITQTNTKVLGEVPAIATGNLVQMANQSSGLAMQNAVNNQQQSNMIHQAATTQGINKIYALDSTEKATATNVSAIPRVENSEELFSAVTIKVLKDEIADLKEMIRKMNDNYGG